MARKRVVSRSKWEPKTKPRFKIGDWVYWYAGTARNMAVVTRVDGPLGDPERWSYGLRSYSLWTDVMDYGLSEEHLTPAPKPEVLPEPHQHVRIA